MEQELQSALDEIKFRERVNGLYCQKILKLDFEELKKLLTDENYEKNFIKQLEQQQKEFDIYKEQF